MFAYNPAVQDRSGEILAQGATNYGNQLAQGIGQFSQGIGGALNQLAELSQKKQATAGADTAFRPFAQSDTNPNGIPGLSQALDNIRSNSNPYAQQMSYQLLSQFLPQAMHAQQMAANLGFKYDQLAQKTANGSGGAGGTVVTF